MKHVVRLVLLLLVATTVGCPSPNSAESDKEQHRWIGRWETSLPSSKFAPKRKLRLVNREDGTAVSILKSEGEIPKTAKATWKFVSEDGNTLKVEIVAKKTGKATVVTAVFDGNDRFTLHDPSQKGSKPMVFERDKRGD